MSLRTIIPVMYRDASNYKEYGQIAVLGELDATQLDRLRSTLGNDGDGFIPAQLGLDHLGGYAGWDFPGQDDHCWHEMDLDSITTEDADIPQHGDNHQLAVYANVDALLGDFEKAKADGWDDAKFGVDADDSSDPDDPDAGGVPDLDLADVIPAGAGSYSNNSYQGLPLSMVLPGHQNAEGISDPPSAEVLAALEDQGIMILSDQPTTCPECGLRTTFDELPDGRQLHTCHICDHTFLAEQDEDDAEADLADDESDEPTAVGGEQRIYSTPSETARGKTTPGSTPGSFAPRGFADPGTNVI